MRRATRPRFAACGGLVPFSAAFGRFVVILVFAGGRGLFGRFAASAISATASVASVEPQGRVKRDFLLSLIHCRIGTHNVLSMFGHGEYGSRSRKHDELSHLRVAEPSRWASLCGLYFRTLRQSTLRYLCGLLAVLCCLPAQHPKGGP